MRFIAINDNYDTAHLDSSSSLMLPFKNLMNDSYCRDTSIKIRSHLDVKRRNGEFIGSFAVYGYAKDPENKTVWWLTRRRLRRYGRFSPVVLPDKAVRPFRMI